MMRPPPTSTLFPYTTLFRSGSTTRRSPPARRSPPSPASTASDRKSTRLNSSHPSISYAVFCLKKKKLFDASDGPDKLLERYSVVLCSDDGQTHVDPHHSLQAPFSSVYFFEGSGDHRDLHSFPTRRSSD